MEGKVKWFNRKKGFGFINGNDGNDYFVHHTSLPEGIMINEEDSVSFNPKETERGMQAQDVALLAEASESGSEKEEPSTPEPVADAEEEEAPVEEAPAVEETEEETSSEEEAPAVEETEPAPETEEE